MDSFAATLSGGTSDDQSGDKEAAAPDPLTGNNREFRDPVGAGLIERTARFHAWQQARQHAGYWPYSRALRDAPASTTRIADCRGRAAAGVNFASQDYLSLATSAELQHAAIEAIERFGVHSAGSAAVLGNTTHSLALEEELGDFLRMPHVTLFPTGWAAGYGVSRGLVRRDDYIVMDALAHSCLAEGAFASTPKVSTFRHLDHDHACTLLARIRRHDTTNAIMVITEGLFSMDSDSPDIPALAAVCREFNASLVVDVAHDLGALGPGGSGVLGMQGMLGEADLVMGSFSKTFASNGGFVACREASVKQFLKIFSPPQTFSNALSPAQAAVVRRALAIVRSPEGARLRGCLMRNIESLRVELTEVGLTPIGVPSPIVPVLIGREDRARVTASLLPDLGVLANLAEFPAVPENQARLRLQVMAGHSADEARAAARGIATAVEQASQACP
ncbi:MAG: aminotransferase class I/II-fold pyridoxal phosphate-dependent enzyme [Burkholderiales bacterium]